MPEKRLSTFCDQYKPTTTRQGIANQFNSSLIVEGEKSLCLISGAFRAAKNLPPCDTSELRFPRRVSTTMDDSQGNQKRPERKKRRGVAIPSTIFNGSSTDRGTTIDAALDEEIMAEDIVSMPRSFPPQEIDSTSRIDRPPTVDSSITKRQKKKRRIASSLEESVDEEITLLGEDFEPGMWHVICGRSKHNFDHVGNRRLRLMVANNLRAYVEANSRRDKSSIISNVVVEIRQSCVGGGFVRKRDDKRWVEVGPKMAREKVSHAFRDALLKSARNQPAGSNEEIDDPQYTWREAQNTILRGLDMQSSESGECGSAEMMLRSAEVAIVNYDITRFEPLRANFSQRPQYQANQQLRAPHFLDAIRPNAISTSTSTSLAYSSFGPGSDIPNGSVEPREGNQISESLRGRPFPPAWL